MSLRIRNILGIVLATVAAIFFLEFSDSQSRYALPSRLYREGNDLLGTGLPWWVAAGGIVGLLIGLSLIRSERQVQQGFINVTATIALVAVILSYVAFTSAGYAVTLSAYLLVAVINILLLFFVAGLPAVAALVLVSMLTSRPPKRSAWEIMPSELKEELLHRPTPQKFSLFAWLTRHNHQESK